MISDKFKEAAFKKLADIKSEDIIKTFEKYYSEPCYCPYADFLREDTLLKIQRWQNGEELKKYYYLDEKAAREEQERFDNSWRILVSL